MTSAVSGIGLTLFSFRSCRTSFVRARRASVAPRDASFEDRVRSWEAEYLWDMATPSYPAIRREPEPDSPMRTPFQRDRDRIVHSKAFRRLKHKTQVFIAPEGDHYRTRLTHTLETCGIARTVARALGLNEDLTEAIGLGHDLGHPPFGHIGEEALDEALRERGDASFRHNGQSLRVVDVLERDGRGLNLTEPVRDGILNHTGPEQAGDARGAGGAARRPGRLHQPRHRRRAARRDHRGGRSAGGGDRAARADGSAADRHARPRHRRARRAAAGDIAQSEEVGGAMLRLRKFMFERVYLGEEARSEHERVRDAPGALRPLPGEPRRGAPRRTRMRVRSSG